MNNNDSLNPFNDNSEAQIQPQSQPQNPTPTGIFTEGIAPVEAPRLSIAASPKKHSKKIISSIISIILIAILGIGSYFLFHNLVLPKKTIAEFEQIVTDLGYTRPGNDYALFSNSNGSYTLYYKNNSSNNSVENIALFYEMKSKDALKSLIEEEISDSTVYSENAKKLFDEFDWSKERNEAEMCEQMNYYTCMKIVQIDNTMLSVISATNSVDTTKSEIETVVTAMGY